MKLEIVRRSSARAIYKIAKDSPPTRSEVEAFLADPPGRSRRTIAAAKGLLLDAERLDRIPDIRRLTALEELIIFRSRARSLRGLERMKGIRRLSLRVCEALTDASAVAHLPELVSLDVFQCIRLGRLPRLAHLESLDITGSTALRLPALERPELLEQLKAPMVPSERQRTAWFKGKVGLKALRITGWDVEDFRFLQECRALRELQAPGCPDLTSAAGLELAPDLRLVNLCGCEKLESVASLDACRKLQWVFLEDCPRLTDLGELRQRKRLNLYAPTLPKRRSGGKSVQEVPFAKLMSPGTELRLANGKRATVELERAGALVTPSGRIGAGDPFVADASSLGPKVEAGRYPVMLALVRATGRKSPTVAAAWVQLARRKARRFVRLRPTVSVDSARAAFFDLTAARRLFRNEERFEAALSQLEQAHVGQTIIAPRSGANLVCFPSGEGDGDYPTFAGVDGRGERVCVGVDFQVVATRLE